MKTAILLIAHGSRIPEANDAVTQVAAMVRERGGYPIVRVSFLERHSPTVSEGIDACVDDGAERVMLIPYFLHPGAHVREGLPKEAEKGRQRHPGVEIAVGKHLGVHKGLAEIVIDRVEESFGERGWK